MGRACNMYGGDKIRTGFCCLKIRLKTPFGRSSVEGIIILNVRKRSRTGRRGLDESGIGKSGRLFELGNEYRGFIKCADFLN
jgi:hypothetical protein